MDVDRIDLFEPLKSKFTPKIKVRRTIETEGIPYTYVLNNFFAGIFLPNLSQLGATNPPRDKVSILGDGNPKGKNWLYNLLILELRNLFYHLTLLTFVALTVVFNKEEDIATYTINSVDDPRTLNKILYIRPSNNTLSFNELITLWERKIGKTLERNYVPEEQILKQIQG